MKKQRYSTGADRLGIASAVICTVHCLVVPVFFLLKYTAVGSLLPPWWDTLDYFFLVISFIAVYHASSHAAGKSIKYFLWLFWLFLAVAIVFEDRLHWMAYIASTGLIGTHVANIRKHQVQLSARKTIAAEGVVTE